MELSNLTNDIKKGFKKQEKTHKISSVSKKLYDPQVILRLLKSNPRSKLNVILERQKMVPRVVFEQKKLRQSNFYYSNFLNVYIESFLFAFFC